MAVNYCSVRRLSNSFHTAPSKQLLKIRPCARSARRTVKSAQLKEMGLMKRRTMGVVAMMMGILVMMTGCNLSRRDKGAAIGVAAGGAAGAVVGNATGSTARGAIIGAVIGGV